MTAAGWPSRAWTRPRIGDLAAAHGIAVHELVPRHASLEHAYLDLTSGSADYRAANFGSRKAMAGLMTAPQTPRRWAVPSGWPAPATCSRLSGPSSGRCARTAGRCCRRRRDARHHRDRRAEHRINARPPPAPVDPLTASFLGYRRVHRAAGHRAERAVFTSEYASGLIRTTFTAVPRRGTVLAAKAAVTGAAALVVGEVLAFACFLLTQAIASGRHGGLSLSHPGVPGAVLAAGLRPGRVRRRRAWPWGRSSGTPRAPSPPPRRRCTCWRCCACSCRPRGTPGSAGSPCRSPPTRGQPASAGRPAVPGPVGAGARRLAGHRPAGRRPGDHPP